MDRIGKRNNLVKFDLLNGNNNFLQKCIYVILFAVSSSVSSAPLDISDVPLELTPSIAPNVLFLNNDSASMDWEVLTEDAINGGKFNAPQPDGTGLPTQITQREDQGDNGADANCLAISSAFGGYAYAVAFATNTDIPATAGSENCFVAADDAWRFRTVQFNPFYFDPNQSYQPWSGTDFNGNTFDDADIQNAPDNPYCTCTGTSK